MIDLDHLGLATSDLDRACEVYRRMGFTMTAKSSHQGPVPPHGETGKWGSGNYCMMLERGYFELIGITDPALPHPMVSARLEKYAGLHIVALGAQDGEAEAAALGDRLGGVEAPYDLVRDVPYGAAAGETREGRFRIFQIDEAVMPEGDIFLIEHQTREVLWQPALMVHANGVTGLGGVTILADDLDQSRARFARLFDMDGTAGDGEVCFPLAAGTVRLVNEAALERRYPGVAAPCAPWVAAVEFTVRDMAALTARLADNGFDPRPADGGGLWLAPHQAEGAVVQFAQ